MANTDWEKQVIATGQKLQQQKQKAAPPPATSPWKTSPKKVPTYGAANLMEWAGEDTAKDIEGLKALGKEKEQKSLLAEEQAKAKAEKDIMAKNLATGFDVKVRKAQMMDTQNEYRGTEGYSQSKGSGMLSNVSDFIGANVDDYSKQAQDTYRENYLRAKDAPVVGFGSKLDNRDMMGRITMDTFVQPADEHITGNENKAIENLRRLNLSPAEFEKQKAAIRKQTLAVRTKTIADKIAKIDKNFEILRQEEQKQIQQRIQGKEKLRDQRLGKIEELDTRLTGLVGEQRAYELLTNFKNPAEAEHFINFLEPVGQKLGDKRRYWQQKHGEGAYTAETKYLKNALDDFKEFQSKDFREKYWAMNKAMGKKYGQDAPQNITEYRAWKKVYDKWAKDTGKKRSEDLKKLAKDASK